MREGKGFFIEKGHIVTIRNEFDVAYGFGSFDEFAQYTPELNVSRCYDYYFLNYEPDRKVHLYNLQIDKPDADLKKGPVPDKIFDAILDNFPLIQQRRNDPFWGMSLNAAKDFGIKQIDNKTLLKINSISNEIDKWKFEVGIHNATKKQDHNNRIKAELLESDEKKQQIENASKIEDIRKIVSD